MKVDVWMPLYVGDYLAATQHLSALESGAYLHLLMHEWNNGPLPSSMEMLRRIGKVERTEWEHAWEMLKAFFDQQPDGTWIQTRLERVRVESVETRKRLTKQRSDAANRRWGKSESEETDADADATAMQPQCENDADTDATAIREQCSSPLPLNDLKSVLSADETGATHLRDSELERIYEAYPRKVGKKKALQCIRVAAQMLATGKDWPALAAAEACAFLHERVTAFARSPAGQQGEYTPHPATWFGQARYFDDPKEWERNGITARGTNGTNSGQRNGSHAGQSTASARNQRSSEAIKNAFDRFRSRPTTGPDDAD